MKTVTFDERLWQVVPKETTLEMETKMYDAEDRGPWAMYVNALAIAPSPLSLNERQPRFKIGTVYKSGGKHPNTCTVTDILTTRDSKGDLVAIRYVSIHNFCGQMVADNDVVETTIARGLVSEPGEQS